MKHNQHLEIALQPREPTNTETSMEGRLVQGKCLKCSILQYCSSQFRDQDNDPVGQQCSQWLTHYQGGHRGGWWFNYCAYTVLTGGRKPSDKNTPNAITWNYGGSVRQNNWNSWKGAEMTIFPIPN